jgi:hypothetical protein
LLSELQVLRGRKIEVRKLDQDLETKGTNLCRTGILNPSRTAT